MIKESTPDYSIGLYGEWGTGKTTLMKSMYENLKNDINNNSKIIPVWFNAWIYERENEFALFPLLQTIVNEIPNTKINKTIKQNLTRLAQGVGKGLLKSSPEVISYLLPSIFSKQIKGTIQKVSEEVTNEFISLFDRVNEKICNEMLYSLELENIKNEISKIRSKNCSFRIVVFVDDLDRCTPTTTLQVFESIKVFLGIEGFIYVLGISNHTITKFINFEFKNLIDGEHYLRKVIQIPIRIPGWGAENIENELLSKYANKLDQPYNQLILKNKEFITNLLEFNPREIKRFINSFLIARELFRDKINLNDQTNKEILVVQALKLRFPDFFDEFSTNSNFRNIVNNYLEDIKSLDLLQDSINERIRKRKGFKNKPFLFIETKLFEFSDQYELWKFIFQNKKILFDIKNWKLYNQLAMTTTESVTASTTLKFDIEGNSR